MFMEYFVLKHSKSLQATQSYPQAESHHSASSGSVAFTGAGCTMPNLSQVLVYSLSEAVTQTAQHLRYRSPLTLI